MKRKMMLAVLMSMTLAAGTIGCGEAGTASPAATEAAAESTETAENAETAESAETAAESGETLESTEAAAGADTESGTAEVKNEEPAEGEQPPELPEGEAPQMTDGENGQGGPGGNGQTPPEKPDGESGQRGPGGDGQTPPEKPDSESGQGGPGGDGQTPPGKPDGESGQGGPGGDGQTSPEKPDGESGQRGPGGDGGFGGSGEVTQGTAVATISESTEISGETYSSTGDDENALRVEGSDAEVTLDGITVDKSAGASSNVEDGDFYGMNAGLLATDGATVTITGATVTTSARNGNGVFSYGSGTTVNISDSTIATTADNSGGIQTTGGGTTNASNLTVTTEGNSSAAIRSDRGGGTVNADGGSYTSNGYNSPAVYSTADITVKNAELSANNSEALVIEGKNSITLEDTDVSGNMSDDKGSSSDINVHNVMIYQSMSGDADEGTSSFSMKGGTLTSNNGDMIYVTNTACTIALEGVTVVQNDADANLLTVSGNDASHGWGAAGANGGDADVSFIDQTIAGDIVVDSISTLKLTLAGSTTFEGTVNIVENADGGEAVSDNAAVTVEKGSSWTLTGDCTISTLVNEGTINFNGYTITLADGTVLGA